MTTKPIRRFIKKIINDDIFPAAFFVVCVFLFFSVMWILSQSSLIYIPRGFWTSITSVFIQAIGEALVLVYIFVVSHNKQDKNKQVRDNFSQAIKQLGDKSLMVRLGGIYLCEQIAKESEIYYWQVMEILTVYVREKAYYQVKQQDIKEKTTKRISTDVQAVLTVLGRCNRSDIGLEKYLDLSRTDLRGAILNGANLEGVNFFASNLQGASFWATNLKNVCLDEANLEGVNFVKTNLKETSFNRADLERASFRYAYLHISSFTQANLKLSSFEGAVLKQVSFFAANLQEVCFKGANLQGVSFEEANLKYVDFLQANVQRANFKYANLEGINLQDASLKGANLELAHELSPQALSQAYVDKTVLLPNSQQISRDRLGENQEKTGENINVEPTAIVRNLAPLDEEDEEGEIPKEVIIKAVNEVFSDFSQD